MITRAIGVIVAGLTLASGGLPGAAWAQGGASRPPAGVDSKPIGQVQNVTGSATIEHPVGVIVQANLPSGGLERTKVKDPIYLGDVIQTGADSSIGIIFGDGTSFNASSNARMEVNEFIYDPKGSSNSTMYKLTKGTFTFLAGKAAKTGSMKVETPVGTMGIRGTAPHVEIVDDSTVKFTTLIEEDKNSYVEPPVDPAAAQRQRRAEAPWLHDAFARLMATRNWNKILTICRGC